MAGLIKLKKRRRQENRTDYKARLSLLKSNLKRIVIRRSNKYISLQVIESNESKDKVLFGLTSKALIEYGWNEKFSGSLKSIPAGYLAGLLFAKKIDNKEKYIIDLGMAKNIKGSRLFATVKGIVDGGIKINADKKIFPDEKRLDGMHQKKEMSELIKKIKAKIIGEK